MAVMAKNKKDGAGPKKDRHLSNKMVRVSGPHLEQLKKLAKRNHRPLSWELSLLIEEALKTNGLWPPEASEND